MVINTKGSLVKVDDVVRALQTVIDPELELDLWYLGLIYDIAIQERCVEIVMTFTSPFCPMADDILREVKEKVGALPGVDSVKTRVVFDPPWQPPDDLAGMLGFM